MYDDILLYLLCEYYIYMCTQYNKVANIYGFSAFTGIDDGIIVSWESKENQRPGAYNLVKRLRKAYETSLENGAQSGKNPVGFIAALNPCDISDDDSLDRHLREIAGDSSGGCLAALLVK